MDGDIGVESTPGKGSTFWFMRFLIHNWHPVRHSRRPMISGLRIFIVDDNTTNRNILRYQFQAWNVIIESAENGEDALTNLRSAVARGIVYDLAILDMHMPHMTGAALAEAMSADPTLADLPILLLTAVGQRSDIEAAHRVGVFAYFSKPLRQVDLATALQAIKNKEPFTSAHEELTTLSSRTTQQEAPKRLQFNARILLTEDNLVNQEVARTMLQLLGCDVTLAQNGREAVYASEREAYDLILMDCQMPEMDGFEATRLIREREAALQMRNAKCEMRNGEQENTESSILPSSNSAIRNLHSAFSHVPIIALTANAMEKDRQRCLDAGMDDYLSKPFSQDSPHRSPRSLLNRTLTAHHPRTRNSRHYRPTNSRARSTQQRSYDHCTSRAGDACYPRPLCTQADSCLTTTECAERRP